MLNHEWLKHGGCYSPGEPLKYFTDALAIDTQLDPLTSRINSLNGTTVLTADIQKLYPGAVNVICDPRDTSASVEDGDVGNFLELQTCWSRTGEPLDCPPAGAYSFTAPCPTYTYLRA